MCTTFTAINQSSDPWNYHDGRTLVSSAETCRKKYRTCLKQFIKTDKIDYQAICE